MLRVMADCVVCGAPVEVGWGPHLVPICPTCEPPLGAGLPPGGVPSPHQQDPLVDRRRRGGR